MAFECHVGELTQKTSTGTQAETGVGFTPKAIVFWLTDQTADGSGAGYHLSWGLATTTSEEKAPLSLFADDAAGTTNTGRSNHDTVAILHQDGGGTEIGADINSLDADGFTLNFSTTDGGSRKIGYLALGGDDLTNTKLIRFTSATSTGNQAVTGVGFQPDCILFFANVNTSATSLGSANIHAGIGAAVSSTARWAAGWFSADNQATSNTSRYLVSDACIAVLNGTSVLEEADFVSMDSDGFTINWGTINGTARNCWALCLKGGQYAVGTETQKTSTGTKATTGVGFTPTGLIACGVNGASSTSVQDDSRISFGAASGATERGCIWGGDSDNVGTSVTDEDYDSAAVLKHMTEGTPTVDAEADLDSFDSDGFTLDWVTADATAREFGYLAFGSDSTDYTLSCESGSFTETGTAVTLTATRQLGVDGGLYAVSADEGDSVTNLYRHFDLGVDAGSYTFTGAATTLSRTRNLVAGSGSYTFTGTDATLSQGSYTLDCEAAAYFCDGSSLKMRARADRGLSRHGFPRTGASFALTPLPKDFAGNPPASMQVARTRRASDAVAEGQALGDWQNSAIVAGTGIDTSYDSASEQLTVTADLGDFDTDSLTEGASNLYYTDERVDDRVDALLTEGSNITLTYDDGAGTLTIAAAASGISNVVEDTTPQLGGTLDVNGNVIHDSVQASVIINDHLQLSNNSTTYDILDGAGDKVLKLHNRDTSGTNVNCVEILNSATANAVQIQAYSGTTSNVGIEINPKNAGAIVLDGLSWPTSDGTNGQSLITDGAGSLSFSSVSGGMSDLVDDMTPQLGGNLDHNGNTFDVLSHDGLYDNGNSGTSKTINWNNGNFQKLTLTGNVTLSFTAPPGPAMLYLELIQDATGGRTVTYPSSAKFPGGMPTGPSSGNGDISITILYYNGTDYKCHDSLLNQVF